MYVKSFDDLIEVLTAQKSNLSTYAGELGATAQDIVDVGEEYQNAQYLKSFAMDFDADKGAFFQLKETYLKGPVGSPVGTAPVFQVFAWPIASVAAGQFALVNTRNRRFRNSPTYTEEAGMACLVSSQPSPPPDPALVKPTGEAQAAMYGFAASVVVSGRQKADRWVLFGRTSSTAQWQMIDSFTDKAGNFVRPGPAGAPYVLELYIQLMQKDEPYGQPSDTFYVTLNP